MTPDQDPTSMAQPVTIDLTEDVGAAALTNPLAPSVDAADLAHDLVNALAVVAMRLARMEVRQLDADSRGDLEKAQIAVDKAARLAHRLGAAARALPGGGTSGAGRRLLVVDDDDDTRTLVAAELRRRGYQVTEASDGAAAMAGVDASIEVLVSDVMLPGMIGTDPAAELSARRPGLAVVFMTGLSPATAGPMLPPGVVISYKSVAIEHLVSLIEAAAQL